MVPAPPVRGNDARYALHQTRLVSQLASCLRTSIEGETLFLLGRSTLCYVRVMARSITQRELRNDSGEVMRQLDQGQSFIVTRNGAPVGELTPLRRHRFVTADAAIAMFANAPRIDAERFRADLDALALQGIDPRA